MDSNEKGTVSILGVDLATYKGYDNVDTSVTCFYDTKLNDVGRAFLKYKGPNPKSMLVDLERGEFGLVFYKALDPKDPLSSEVVVHTIKGLKNLDLQALVKAK